MMTRSMRGALLFGIFLIVAACGRQSAEQSRSADDAQASAAVATPNLANASAQQSPAAAAAEPATITRVNEDGSETVEDSSGDSGLHNALLAAVASTAAAATLSAPTPWQEGVNYMRLVPAQPTAVPSGQVEVLEFFWYACPHCYAIDPLVETWKKTKPAYISFSRVPVMWNEGHRSLARLYYTLDSMGKLNDLHAAIWKEIHVKNDPTTGMGFGLAKNGAGCAPDCRKTALTMMMRLAAPAAIIANVSTGRRVALPHSANANAPLAPAART